MDAVSTASAAVALVVSAAIADVFVAILFVTVVLKLASSPSASANSFNVLSVPGAVSTKFAIAVSVYTV